MTGSIDDVTGPTAKDVGGARHERRFTSALVGLLREGALGPVDPAVEPKIGAVEIVGASRQRFRLEPLLALVGDSVTVGVGQLPDARRRRHVERPVQPHRPLRKHHLVGKDGARVVASVAVLVHETDDAMRPVRELLLDLVVRAGGIGDVQAAVFVEVGDDGAVHEGRPGDALDLESGWHRDARNTCGRRLSL